MTNTMFIMRGLPGSGKSTKALELVDGKIASICCADDYHMVDGKYDWQPRNVAYAHKQCLDKANELCLLGYPKVAVANTNILISHMVPYFRIAKKYMYDVILVLPDVPWAWDVQELFNRNVHSVPFDTIERMKSQFQPWKNEYAEGKNYPSIRELTADQIKKSLFMG